MEYDYEDYYSEEEDDEYDQPMFCYCQGHCSSGEAEGICEISTGGKCFTTVEEEEDDSGNTFPLLSYGCFSDGEAGAMQCKANLGPYAKNKSIKCCDDGDFCNKNLFAEFANQDYTENFNHNESLWTIVSIVGACIFVVILLLSTVFTVFKKNKKKQKNENIDNEMKNNKPTSVRGDDKGKDEQNLNKSSDEAGPKMVQKTIAQQIEKEHLIEEGGFGEIWLAKWRYGKVAVKVFSNLNEKLWSREKEIYKLMSHDNILGFIGEDIIDIEGEIQPILVTEYHKNGSLYNFLKEHTLCLDSLLKMCRSIAKGLSYLHNEVFGAPGKPSIAHKNLQSKNILVKANGECCLANFELAINIGDSENNAEISADELRSKRYMAPEILDGKIHVSDFTGDTLVDMYACGLIFWEMTRRCKLKGNPVSDYAMPYHDQVPCEPTFEDMRDVVCVKKNRPDIPQEWYDIEVTHTLAKTMKELWHENPAARLTALRVKKTLNKCENDVVVDIGCE